MGWQFVLVASAHGNYLPTATTSHFLNAHQLFSPCDMPNNHPIKISMLSHAGCDVNLGSASPFRTGWSLQVVTVFCTLLNLGYLFCNSPNYAVVT